MNIILNNCLLNDLTVIKKNFKFGNNDVKYII